MTITTIDEARKFLTDEEWEHLRPDTADILVSLAQLREACHNLVMRRGMVTHTTVSHMFMECMMRVAFYAGEMNADDIEAHYDSYNLPRLLRWAPISFPYSDERRHRFTKAAALYAWRHDPRNP